MPNLLRRLLEVYAGFNYPSECKLSGALKLLIKDDAERVLVGKMIDEHSHSALPERAFKLNEPDEILDAINITFRALENARPDYMTELKKVAGIS